MNSALKPSVLPTSGANQTPQSQHNNKPMHPQGAPSFGQPSGHVNQNPFPNMNAAHNHPNAQQNHFGISAAAHYNMGTIPPSNHPVASLNPSPASQQIFGAGAKGLGYPGGYQGSMAHQQNQNSLPPVSQTLPATTNQTPPPQIPTNSTAQAPEVLKDHPIQANGTSESKTENHISPQLQTSSVAQEKPKPAPTVQEQKPPPEPEVVKQSPPQQQQQQEAKHDTQTPLPAPVPETRDVTTPVATTAETKSSTSEQESLSSPAKSTEKKTDTVKDGLVKEPETISTSDESCVSDGKAATSEDAIDAKEGSETDAPSESSAEETASDKTKPDDVDNVNDDDDDNDVVMESPKATTKGTKEQQSPSKKEASSPAKPPSQKTTPIRKQRSTTKVEETKTPKQQEAKTPATIIQKSPSTTGKVKRQRLRTQHYQSPLPELEIITKISSTTPRAKANDDKLIYFYKNEFMAVRNAEGGFYLCQAVQNIYKSSSKIKIRWLSQDKNDKSGEIYTPDFYDLTDFDCILTSLDLTRVDKGKYRLSPAEKERTDSILKRCLAVENGEISTPPISEEHPDGLDLSLYKAEDQLKKNKRGPKRKSRSPAKSPQKSTPATKKSPEAAKVRKVDAAVKAPGRKVATTNARKSSSYTPTKKPSATASSTMETKKAVAAAVASTGSSNSSRLSRGKSKGDIKSSPVVDQKKAKVLAKIGRKTATVAEAATTRSQPSKTKNAKAASSKSVTSSTTVKQSKQQPPAAAVATRPASTRKIKRSGRK